MTAMTNEQRLQAIVDFLDGKFENDVPSFAALVFADPDRFCIDIFNPETTRHQKDFRKIVGTYLRINVWPILDDWYEDGESDAEHDEVTIDEVRRLLTHFGIEYSDTDAHNFHQMLQLFII